MSRYDIALGRTPKISLYSECHQNGIPEYYMGMDIGLKDECKIAIAHVEKEKIIIDKVMGINAIDSIAALVEEIIKIHTRTPIRAILTDLYYGEMFQQAMVSWPINIIVEHFTKSAKSRLMANLMDFKERGMIWDSYGVLGRDTWFKDEYLEVVSRAIWLCTCGSENIAFSGTTYNRSY
jgi:hypothetical protein